MADPVRGAQLAKPLQRLFIALTGRILAFAGAIVGTIFLLQFLLWSAPGDPIDMLPLYGSELERIRPELERLWGLDLPPFQRIMQFFAHAIQGDLGESLIVHKGQPVATVTSKAWAHSIRILVPALILSLALSLLIAWHTAGRRAASVRVSIQIVSILPIFLFICLIIQWDDYVWSLIQQDKIERPSWFPLHIQESPIRNAVAVAILAVGSNCLAEVHSTLENAILRVRDSGFVTAARARGERVWPHILRNILPEIVHLGASRVVLMTGGLVILEHIFNMNGAGAKIWTSCVRRDYPLALGLVLGAALLVCSCRLAADVFRLLWDPRAKWAKP